MRSALCFLAAAWLALTSAAYAGDFTMPGERMRPRLWFSGCTLNPVAKTLTCPGGGITINSSSITGGVSGRILYDNGGVVGEATRSGNTTTVATTSGTLTNGDCVQIDSNGNLVDAGSACGGAVAGYVKAAATSFLETGHGGL